MPNFKFQGVPDFPRCCDLRKTPDPLLDFPRYLFSFLVRDIRRLYPLHCRSGSHTTYRCCLRYRSNMLTSFLISYELPKVVWRRFDEDSFQGNRSQTQWQSGPLGLPFNGSYQGQRETSKKFYHKELLHNILAVFCLQLLCCIECNALNAIRCDITHSLR